MGWRGHTVDVQPPRRTPNPGHRHKSRAQRTIQLGRPVFGSTPLGQVTDPVSVRPWSVRVSVALIEFEALEAPRMTSPPGIRRSITAESFRRLLQTLHPDADEAAHEYERLHRALVKFFDWRGVWPADECADDVLDRLARRLEETQVQNVRSFVYGIARLVALERQRGPAFDSIDDVPHVSTSVPATRDDGHELHDCFDRCLAELPEDSRSLILRYYEGERSAKISNRRRLATALGLSENALRSRVQRLRDRLEQCVQACTAEMVRTTP